MPTTNNICYTWDDAPFSWNSTEFTWKDFCTASEFIDEVLKDATGSPSKVFRKLSKNKKLDIVELLIRVYSLDPNQTDYLSRLSKEKSDDVNITISDVEILAKEVLGTKLKIANIK